jgi:hypothetical protein
MVLKQKCDGSFVRDEKNLIELAYGISKIDHFADCIKTFLLRPCQLRECD